MIHDNPRPNGRHEAGRGAGVTRTPTISVAAAEDIRLGAGIHSPVLITAASRRLREVCARLIHLNSLCGRGPFTAATADATDLVARFDATAEGTLFVDDIAMFDVSAQRILMDLLDRGPRPPYVTTARVIAGASHRLDRERANGAFAEDLFYRLNVIHIDLVDPGAWER